MHPDRDGMIESVHGKTRNFSHLEYRRKWLHQLQAEFRQICSWYRISLATPAFRICDSLTEFGSWQPETRTIAISATLINEYSWDTVINILKHEMAHQYVHEHMSRGNELPHGPAFAEACSRLGVVFPFNTAAGNTPKVFSNEKGHECDSEYERKVQKVRKMLSLAGSCNEHEAAVAMSKANSFIRRYNLERLESNETSHYNYTIVKPGKKRLQVIERRIAGLLMDYFYVDIIYSELFDPVRLESFKTIEMLGTRENVAFAKFVYEFLSQRTDLLWRSFRKDTKVPGRLRKTYILGLLQGFREKLEKDEKKDVKPVINSGVGSPYKTMSALVVAEDTGLSEFVGQRFPRLRKVQYRSSGIYCADTFRAGKAEGRKITIHKPVTRADGNHGRLLGN